MKTQTVVCCTLHIAAIHAWPDAPVQVYFLQKFHRHVFHIKCCVPVEHDDRDVEFIMLKNKIATWLIEQFDFDEENGALFLGSMSCEMLAKQLIEAFDLSYCSVYEDGENGAEVTRIS